MVASEPVPSTRVHPSLWVRSAAWDLFWLHGGLWLAPLAVWSSWGWQHPDDSPAHIVYLLLAALFWIGHRFSSTWLAWFTTAYAEARMQQPVRFWWVPLGVLLATATIVLAPTGWLPGTWVERVVVLGVIDYLLVSYHFAAQHFGILSLYRTRAGRRTPPTIRRMDRAYALIVGGLVIVLAELLQGATTLPGVWADRMPTPDQLAALQVPLVVGTLAFTGTMLFAARRTALGVPRQLYIVGLAVMAVTALVAHPFVYIFCWTAQHWLGAVGLATLVAGGGPDPAPNEPIQRLFHAINRPPGRFLLTIALLSALSMPFYEVEASAGPADRPTLVALDTLLNGLLSSPIVLQALTALGLATAFLHYLLDRAVWRFSDPTVRRAAGPLLEPPQ